MSHSLKLLIFDFDGTLAHTAPGIHKAVNVMLERRQRPQLSLETVTSYIGQGLFNLICKLNVDGDLTPQAIETISQEFRDIYKDIFLHEVNIFEGALEFLKSTPLALAIVSNKEEHFIRKTIEHSAFASIPWVSVYGGDSFEQKKPHPMPLQKVMDEAEVHPQETLMIGDSFADRNAAQQAGTHFMAVSFGYEDLHSLTDQGALPHFDHYSELTQKISKLFKGSSS